MSALPIRDHVGHQIEVTPRLRRKDHRRGITKLVDDEKPAVRRRPVQAAWVSGFLSEGTIRITRYLYAELVVKSVGTIDLDVDRCRCSGGGIPTSSQMQRQQNRPFGG